jgi:hypothetical protein
MATSGIANRFSQHGWQIALSIATNIMFSGMSVIDVSVPRTNLEITSLLTINTHGGNNTDISKKIFRSGGMAPSEWTRSVRAVRDTPVADYSAPGINTTRRVVYRPPIAVLLSLRVLSVSYFKRSLWRCGQL